ncbi:MAG: right-handed parallel beta-helix repeat-containing protein [Gemmatimonadota bacterium]
MPPDPAVLTVAPGTELPDLEAARDRLRHLRWQGGLEGGALVEVRGGTYLLERGLALGPEDGGTAAAPIRYRAAPGERVRLLGGRLLAHFEPVRDAAVRQRLAPAAREQVVECDLRAAGIADFGRLVSRGFGRPTSPAHLELFVNGRRAELARWPDEGYARITAPGRLDRAGDGHGGSVGVLEAGFVFDGDRPRRWRSTEGVWVHGFWAWDWANSYEAVRAFDSGSGLVLTHPPHGLYGFRAGQRFYFLNVLEELDRPGEYYVDAERGALYYWPAVPLDRGEVAASLVEEPLIRVDGAGHLSFEGISLAYGRGAGIEIRGGAGVTVAGCEVTCMGNYAVVVDGGTGHRVRGCDLHRLGDGGVRISGGDRRTLTPAGHEVDNCHIHHLGEWSRCYQPGAILAGVGHRVTRNLIHDGPHTAILINGNDHLIEGNHIHHVCQETGDVGAFYMGRDWTERGNVVRHNLFHHTHGVGMGSMAVYLDDCASGTEVRGNLFYRCTRAVFIGGGRDHRVENNVFVECQPAVMIDGRGLDPRPVWHDMVYRTMRERLDAMAPHQPPYSERHPELQQLERFYQGQQGVPPEGNVVSRNLCWGGEWLTVHWHADPTLVQVRDNAVGGDPGFADPRPFLEDRQLLRPADFALRPDAPAFRTGFEALPLDCIGLHLDDARQHLPEPEPAAEGSLR